MTGIINNLEACDVNRGVCWEAFRSCSLGRRTETFLLDIKHEWKLAIPL